MNILVLNGSPRANGNTAAFVSAFKKGAESAGHSVRVFHVGTMNIGGCLACEYCHKQTDCSCMQQDDMQQIYPHLLQAELIVLASPVHYWSFSAQLQAAITRFYAPVKPAAKKYAMILSSASENVYNAIISQYHDMLSYFGAEDAGILTFCGSEQITEKNLAQIRHFGATI